MSSDLWLQAATREVELPQVSELCLAGFAGRTDSMQGIDQSLELNALLLSTDREAQPFVLVSGDLLYFGATLRDTVRRRLGEHGLDPDRLLLLASHTHYAPSTDGTKPKLGAVDARFVAHLAAAVTDLVIEARGRVPVRSLLRHTRIRASHALHRRRLHWHIERQPPFVRRKAYLGPNPLFRLRDDADVVLFETVDGEPLAYLWSYACHPSSYPRKNFVHSDYIGVVREALRRCHGTRLPVLFAQGAAGDIRADTRTSRPNLLQQLRTINEEQRFTPFSVSGWRNWADSLAERVTAIVNHHRSWSRLEPCLSCAETTIALSALIEGTVPEGTDLRLVALQLGNSFRLLVMNAEPVNGYQKIFSAGNFRAHRVVGYEGNVFGYLPTERMLSEGGYEVRRFFPFFGLTGSFRPGFESKVVAAGRHALRMAAESGRLGER